MTDIQLPLNPTTTNHQQKGGVINSGKLIAKASNLEIRGGSLISNSHNANNPNHATSNNELTGGVVSSSQHHSHANRTTIMSSSKRQQTGQHQTTSSSGQGTLVSLNIIDFKQVGVVAAPRRREHVRNTTRQQQQQPNRHPLVNSNTSSAKKPIPIELTLSTSRLMLNDENNHPAAVNTNQKNVDSLVENIWWPNDDQESVLNAMATNNAANNPSNPHKHHHHHHHVVDNCCNSLSTTSAAWTASTTGVMSDRSSVYSIDDGGDFDREASHKVNKQLKEIEAILYEQVSQLNHHHYHNNNNLNEYKEWSHKFPHLRILGSGLLKDENNQDTTSRSSILNNLNSSSIQIIPANQLNNNNLSTSTNLSKNNNASKELGEQLSELPSSTTTTNKFTRRRENTDLNNQGIYLNGQSISVRKLDANGPPLSNEHRHLEEEIFEQEGTYEELLAYDNQEEEYLVEHNKRLNLTKRRRHGLPPITPKASMRDLVNNFLFDFMWSSLIDWSLALIKEYSKSIVDAQMTMDSLTRANTDISSTSDQQQQQHTPKAVNHQPATTKPAEQNQGGLFNNTANNPVGSSKTASANNQILNPIQIQALKTTPNGGLHAPLKPFDPPLNQSAYFTNSEKPMQPQQSFTPASMSRDNSTLFNSQLSRYNTIINSGEHMHEGKLVDEAIAKYLQIKQLNTFGNSASKNLVPISSGSRVGSGKLQSQVQQQQQQQQQQIRGGPQHYQLGKKRFSSIEVVSSSNQQQQQQQPTSTSALGLTTTTSLSSSASQNSNQMSVHGNALGHKSEQPHSGGSHHHHNANRSGNNSTMMHHHHHDGSDHDLVAAESSLLDAAGGVVAGNEIMSIDEINLINGAGGGHSTSMIKQPAQASSPHVHFYQQPMVQNQPNSVHFLHQLPPIGKPTRISSASNVNTNKERSERPLTSTAIRIDSMNFPLHKRSTTPLGLASSNKVQNYYQSMKRRFNVSLDDPFHINNNTNISANTMSIVNSFSNFLSTKSFNNMSGAQNQQSNNTAATNTLNRRNSIKESQRSHK